MPTHRHLIRNASGAHTLAGGRQSGDSSSWCFDDVPDGSSADGKSGKFYAWDTGGNGAHNHPFTQPTFTGTEQDTMPPYLVVYMWKRIS